MMMGRLVCAAVVSPSKTPREYYSRSMEDKKDQCYRVYRGLDQKEV